MGGDLLDGPHQRGLHVQVLDGLALLFDVPEHPLDLLLGEIGRRGDLADRHIVVEAVEAQIQALMRLAGHRATEKVALREVDPQLGTMEWIALSNSRSTLLVATREMIDLSILIAWTGRSRR